MSEDSGTDDKHLLSSRARPAHAGASQTRLELFDAALGGTRTDGIAVFMELMIEHAVLMGVEIMGKVG